MRFDGAFEGVCLEALGQETLARNPMEMKRFWKFAALLNSGHAGVDQLLWYIGQAILFQSDLIARFQMLNGGCLSGVAL